MVAMFCWVMVATLFELYPCTRRRGRPGIRQIRVADSLRSPLWRSQAARTLLPAFWTVQLSNIAETALPALGAATFRISVALASASFVRSVSESAAALFDSLRPSLVQTVLGLIAGATLPCQFWAVTIRPTTPN